MTLKELVKIASEAYPDDLVQQYHDSEGGGDTLAEFIARELSDTFDEKASDAEQLEEALRAMSTAHRELGNVVTALEEHDGRG